jgi:intraflagellar transport protein 122
MQITHQRLAFVDKNKNLTVIDVITKETIYQEMNVTSCAFNQDFNDMIAYSGNEMLLIRTGNFPPLSQKMSNSTIVGFRGNKLFL